MPYTRHLFSIVV